MNSFKFLVVALLLSFHATSKAQSSKGDRFDIPWTIENKSEIERPILVDRGTLVASARLLPERLFINNDDILDSKGKLFVAKGVEFAFANSNHFSACIINAWASRTRLGRSFKAFNNNTCLQDADRDGKFEHSFFYQSALLSLRATGKVGTVREVTASTYEEADPESSKDSCYLGIYANHSNKITILKVIPTCNLALPWDSTFGSFGGHLGDLYGASDADLPQTLDVFGAQFLLEMTASGQVSITQKSPFKKQSLTIESKFP